MALIGMGLFQMKAVKPILKFQVSLVLSQGMSTIP